MSKYNRNNFYCSLYFLVFAIPKLLGTSVPLSPAYKEYRLESLCHNQKEKVNLYLHNRPAVLTFNTTNSQPIKCHLELHVSEFFGFSIFTEVLKMEKTYQCEKDFVQFGRDFLLFTSHKSDKKCDRVEHTRRILRDDGSLFKIDYGSTPIKKREYIEQSDREMDMWFSITPPAYGKSSKEIKLIVTPFKKDCMKEDHFYWKCPSTDKCIKRELFCDGQINCDGITKEEQVEYCLRTIGGSGVDMFFSIPIIILIVVFSLVALMFIIFVIKLVSHQFKNRSQRSQGPAFSPTQRRPLSLCQSSSTSSGGIMGLQRHLSSESHGVYERENLFPANLPTHPPSYHEAISSAPQSLYSDQPPKYTEVPEGNQQSDVFTKES